MKIRKNIQSIYQKNVDLLPIGEEGERHYVLIKDFNTFIYDHTLHCRRKHFCCYDLQAFSTEEILKHHFKDCFKINAKKRILMPKKGKYVKFKNYERKIKSPFMIYANFESILVPEDNGKPKSKNVLYKHIPKIYCLLLWLEFGMCDDKFIKPFKRYLGKDAVYNFII